MSKSSRDKHNLNLSKLRHYYAIAERQNLPWYKFREALSNLAEQLAKPIMSYLNYSSLARAMFHVEPLKQDPINLVENSNEIEEIRKNIIAVALKKEGL